ncbi:hypothetical protein [Phenylobacterium sp.]|uniref:hypothetical protein n=1 Tax=Phenylobacterium sp. TaxID=1871053 RepID=UPI0027209A18|nr:hypothetical protein [Phenylobacterium sp.]MDO8800040.1 hypothetical protein [Phenylobacterium sp.]
MAATVHITLARSGRDTRTEIARPARPVHDSVPIASDEMTASGTSAKSTIVTTDTAAFWSVTVTGGNILAKFGSDPTAAAGEGWLLLDGQTRDFGVSAVGETIAIKTA